MRWLVLALSCLTCAVHSRKAPDSKLRGHSNEERGKLLMPLAMLLSTFNPAAAFNPSDPGVQHFADKPAPPSWRLSPPTALAGTDTLDKSNLGQYRLLFTVTTFLSRPGKRENFNKILGSLDSMCADLCTKCIIVNEYDEDGQSNADVVDNYPNFLFLQKGKHQTGQPASLNLILDELNTGNYDYWLQWEESWEPTREFLAQAIDIMQKSNVDQLQLNDAWLYGKWLSFVENDGYVIVARTDMESMDDYPVIADINKWPLYSLHPSLNRVSSILKCGRFNTDPNNWPIQFEYMFGLEFARNNLVKAVIRPPSAQRVQGHVSTYLQGEEGLKYVMNMLEKSKLEKGTQDTIAQS